jgi:hypothetical protein
MKIKKKKKSLVKKISKTYIDYIFWLKLSELHYSCVKFEDVEE